MKQLFSILALLFLTAVCTAHGSNINPPPPEEPPPRRQPSRPPPPPPPPPPPAFDDPTPPPDSALPDNPVPTAPTPNKRPPVRKAVRTRPTQSSSDTWKLWWEYNREHIAGLRGMLRGKGVRTAGATAVRDPLKRSRPEVLATLRAIALKGSDRTLRAAALLALARMGTDDDTRLLVRLLHDQRQPRDVQEAAAVGLGVMGPIRDKETRAATHEYMRYAIAHPNVLPTRARGLLLLSTGLRARHDASLSMFLLGQITKPNLPAQEAANLAFACGLAQNPIAVPELIEAVKKGRLGKRKLSDIGRAHATQALARIGDRSTVPLLASLLMARSAGLQVRRSAALAMGRALREGEVADADHKRAARALRVAFEKGKDPVFLGFCAIAMGGAAEPIGIAELQTAIDHGGNQELKPFCAIALGLAAKTLDDRKIRAFLTTELAKTKQKDLSSALCIGLGLAGAQEAREAMLALLENRRAAAGRRAAAAQGLGLLRTKDPQVATTLERLAVQERNPDLVGDLVLALGLLGRRGMAPRLAEMLRKTKSGMLRGRICLALAHLDHEAAADALLAVLKDKRIRPHVREFAAVGLGLMGDRRAEDPLFAIDAYFNFYATTLATNELVRLY